MNEQHLGFQRWVDFTQPHLVQVITFFIKNHSASFSDYFCNHSSGARL